MSGDRHDMSDAEWEILRSVLSHKHQGPERVHDRRVMNGIFFVLRTGTPWRDLPERYGPYTTCYNRYNRWSRNGTWASIMEKLQRLAGDDDGGDDGPPGSVRLRMVDSSSVRVHRHGAGAPRDGAPAQVGLSRGGRTTKVHLGIDGNEMVKTVFLTPGQAADCAQAEALLAGLGHDETVIGDRAYDTDAVLELIRRAGAAAVIPSRSSRKSPRPLDRDTYRTRNLVERFFGKIKEFRRVATRYDKTARNFLSAVHLAVSRFLLRRIANQLFESTA